MVHPTNQLHPANASDAVPIWHRFLPLLVIAAGVAAYANSLHGVFLLDDQVHIVRNTRIRDLSNISTMLSGHRPIVDATLALNYAAAGLQRIADYHIVNIAIHILAGLTLFGLVRRTLLTPSLRDRFGRSAAPLAIIVALAWTLHPLQTQSVTYIIQRAESMMGLFYLLTLYALVRAAAPDSRSIGWVLTAIIACALGMGSKAVMISAPIVALLFDQAFLAGSLRAALRKRYALYLGLAATWSVLWITGIAPSVLSTHNPNAHVGFGYADVSPVEYAMTQFGVVVDYLKLSFWPGPLCLDHHVSIADSIGRIAPPAVVVAGLLALTIWGLIRRRAFGFLGAAFLLILAPTSSIVPIKDVQFEHRMYLPLGVVVVAVVLGARLLLDRLIAAAPTLQRLRATCTTLGVVVALLALGTATARRNRVYGDAVTMWQDVATKRPENRRALEHLGSALIAAGKLKAATAVFERAVDLDPGSIVARFDLANALLQTGRPALAIPHFEEVLKRDPGDIQARMNLGHAYDGVGRAYDAFQTFIKAAETEDPRATPQARARAYYNVGSSVGRSGNIDGAINAYMEAVKAWPGYAKGHYALGYSWTLNGEYSTALPHLERALAIEPNNETYRRARDNAKNRLPLPAPSP